MKMAIKIVVIILFCLNGFTSLAQTLDENAIDINYKECLSKDTTTCNLYNCAFEAYAKWDKMMDHQYKKLLKTLKTDKDKTALKQAQNTWIAYRDNEFKSYDNMFNKPGAKWCLMRASGRIDIVKTRALQLQQYNQAFENKRNR